MHTSPVCPGATSWSRSSTIFTDTVGTGSESDKWMSDQAVNRFLGMQFLSTVVAESPSTYYGWDIALPARYYTRTEGESSQNSVIVLNAHAFYDPDEDFVFTSELVNTLTEAELGALGS